MLLYWDKLQRSGKRTTQAKKGTVRDDANLNQLLALANMESYNAIKKKSPFHYNRVVQALLQKER